jgi:23S rRNA pseudouridine2604 synthase
MEPKRLNKFISDTGFCSRREADELIEQGRVTVNGKLPADAGVKVSPSDKVRIDDEILRVKQEKPVYLIFNKPANMSATSDMSVRDNVVRAINFPATLEPTGMLEREAEGIIFLSNDADFVLSVKKADNRFEKEYSVTVDKPVTAEFLQKLSGGTEATIPGEARPHNPVSKETQNRFRITLKPGTDHYLKRMCESLGYKVTHLQRSRFGEFKLTKLPSGHWRVLTPQEVKSLTDLTNYGKAAKSRPTEARSTSSDRRGTGKGYGAAGKERSGAGKDHSTAGSRNRPATAGGKGAYTKSAPGRPSGSAGTKRTGTGAAAKPTSSRSTAPKSSGNRSGAPKGGPKRGR